MTPDLLVVANPVWEASWLVETLPEEGFDPGAALAGCADGGGSALNTACALACAGWRVRAAGRVGDDPDGRAAIAALERRGVEARIEIAAGRRTKRNHLYVEPGGRRTAFEAFIPEKIAPPWEEIPPGLLEARSLFLDRLASPAGGWLAARHGSTGAWNGLNLNAPGPHGLADPRLRAALPALDYLQIPEQDEIELPAAPLDGGRIHRGRGFPALSDAEAASLLRDGVRALVCTRGSRGAVLRARDGVTILASPVETETVDPTGAGDAFAAGFLDRQLAGAPVDEALRRAADWAARACRHLGARAWLDREPPEKV